MSYRRRNPDFLGVNPGTIEDSAGTAAGAIGTAFLDQTLTQPFVGKMLSGAGQVGQVGGAFVSSFAAHWLVGRLGTKYSRMAAPGINLWFLLSAANSIAPGLIPITVGVPKQLGGLHLFAATQPQNTPAALPGGTAAALGTGTGAPTPGAAVMTNQPSATGL